MAMKILKSLLREEDNWRMLNGVLSVLEPYEMKIWVLRGEKVVIP